MHQGHPSYLTMRKGWSGSFCRSRKINNFLLMKQQELQMRPGIRESCFGTLVHGSYLGFCRVSYIQWPTVLASAKLRPWANL